MSGNARTPRSLLLAVVATALAAAPALAGPPWVSIEYPVNPFDPTTRDALVVIHTYHHGAAMAFPVRAVAEGVVGGQRRHIELPVSRTRADGVWAVGGQLPKEGNWVVVATMTDGAEGAGASALIGFGAGGRLASVAVPHEMRNGWVVPREPTRAEIEDALRAVVASSGGAAGQRAAAAAHPAEGGPAAAWPLAAGLGLALLVPGAARRVRKGSASRRDD